MLPIMASSISSERAFSLAGITISKRCNRLKPDVVEALQVLKCSYHHDLLFREEASTQIEVEDLENYGGEDSAKEMIAERPEGGWDRMVEDMANDEGFVDDDDNNVFIQDIV